MGFWLQTQQSDDTPRLPDPRRDRHRGALCAVLGIAPGGRLELLASAHGTQYAKKYAQKRPLTRKPSAYFLGKQERYKVRQISDALLPFQLRLMSMRKYI
jgi:hypothetical protein